MIEPVLKRLKNICLIVIFGLVAIGNHAGFAQQNLKLRILISSNIGGTDPDDNQSMIHLLMFTDLFQIEGLVASPYGNGRKRNILEMIDL